MTGKLIVFITCQSTEEGETIARSVVQERLAACVNVLPGVRSCFMWDGEMKWSEEVLLLVKTTEGKYAELQSRVKELHSYDVPEIVAVKIEAGLEGYLKWIAQSV
jgi:periplasmic divalent cation tolerance protein